jgi:hypothetical protein
MALQTIQQFVAQSDGSGALPLELIAAVDKLQCAADGSNMMPDGSSMDGVYQALSQIACFDGSGVSLPSDVVCALGCIAKYAKSDGSGSLSSLLQSYLAPDGSGSVE